MKAVMIMFDTLCRNCLSPYGNTKVKTPQFDRLARHSVVFERNYVTSLPCMPARRDFHNSRANFLQRDWGPLEPYDDSCISELKHNGVYTCLISDHYHYWEDGGATYHGRYNSWISHRGQEGDLCQGDREVLDYYSSIEKDNIPDNNGGYMRFQDKSNRKYMNRDEDMPQTKVFDDGLRFIEQNHSADKWFLQIETFDPHEPFFTHEKWKNLYDTDEYRGEKTDWPDYERVGQTDTEEDIDYVRKLYMALVSMCDNSLGRVLDKFDQYNMWDDTMLIVCTDHGFLLGEHGWYGKSAMTPYEEISHTPVFVWDPVSKRSDERCGSLSSMIDLPVTLLDFFSVPIPDDMQGKSLFNKIRDDKNIRDTAIFGYHGSQVCITDGRYVYYRSPEKGMESKCFDYTLMPTKMRQRVSVKDLQQAEFVGPLPGTKGCKVLKIPTDIYYVTDDNCTTALYDLQNDPEEKNPINDEKLEKKYADMLREEMIKAGAPDDELERLGFRL